MKNISDSLFPNPAKRSFYIATQTGISQDATINMLSQDGKLLHTEKVILNGRT